MFKFIFDLATEPLGLPIDWYYEWIILGVIGYIAYLIAYDKVGSLYHGDFVSGRAAGSFFHWIIRTIYFIVMWAPIQISVYEDKIYIWNDGEMPPNLDSTDKLFIKHSSKPYNPKLANVFFKSGMIEAWGRGFEKIREACVLYDGPLLEYEINEAGIMVLCKACDKYLGLLRNDGHHHGQCDQEGDHDDEQDLMRQIIAFCREPKTASEIMQKFNLGRSYFRRHYLDKMLKTGELQRTKPDKPKSKNQKYYS